MADAQRLVVIAAAAAEEQKAVQVRKPVQAGSRTGSLKKSQLTCAHATPLTPLYTSNKIAGQARSRGGGPEGVAAAVCACGGGGG